MIGYYSIFTIYIADFFDCLISGILLFNKARNKVLLLLLFIIKWITSKIDKKIDNVISFLIERLIVLLITVINSTQYCTIRLNQKKDAKCK